VLKKNPTEPNELEAPIARLLELMANADPNSDEYARMTDQLIKLYKLKAETSPKRVSADTWAIIGANLAGIILIIGHERANVIATKAMSFVAKLR
jgi:hypothetical protein